MASAMSPTATNGAQKQHFKVKVCLVGNPAVGKTSLVRRYVMNSFDDRYLTTLGTKVSKKEIEVTNGNGGPVQVDLMIWDIMGQPGFRELLKDAYFYEAKGVLAVCDLTRKDTLDDLEKWIKAVEGVTGKVPIVVAVNKADLSGSAQFDMDAASAVAESLGAKLFFTSAKEGTAVEDAFHELGAKILASRAH